MTEDFGAASRSLNRCHMRVGEFVNWRENEVVESKVVLLLRDADPTSEDLVADKGLSLCYEGSTEAHYSCTLDHESRAVSWPNDINN